MGNPPEVITYVSPHSTSKYCIKLIYRSCIYSLHNRTVAIKLNNYMETSNRKDLRSLEVNNSLLYVSLPFYLSVGIVNPDYKSLRKQDEILGC